MIDFHTHPPAWHQPSWLAGEVFNPQQFAAFLDRAGFAAAVVLSHDGLFVPSPRANDELAAFVHQVPERLFGFGTASPWYPDAPEEIRRCFAELGLRGVKLHPWLQGFSMHEPTLDPILDVVREHDGIVLSHDGTPPYATALQIAALARRHPRVSVVLGHGGLHDTWREALAAVQETANVYLCICGTPPYAAARILRDAPLDRVLFGTDAGLSTQADQHYALARVQEIDGWGITAAQRQAMLIDNPRRLLGL